VRQTWLCKKKDRYVALKMIAPKGEKRVRFEVVESLTEKGLGFDPAAFSKGGNATCPFCGTVADSGYVKSEGQAGRMGRQMMAIVCTRPRKTGKIYLSADEYPEFWPDDNAIGARIEELCRRTGLTVPHESIANLPDDCYNNSLGIGIRPYGLRLFGDLFTPRQMLCLLTFVAAVRECMGELERERVKAVGTYLAVLSDRQADYNSTLCRWHTTGEKWETHLGGRRCQWSGITQNLPHLEAHQDHQKVLLAGLPA